VEQTVGVGTRFAKDELRFPLRLLTDFVAKLLRRNERLVDGFVALAKGPQLFVEAARLGLELLVDARQALQLFGHLLAELVDALWVEAAHGFAELVPSNVEWREMKRFVNHAGLAPNRAVPMRTNVAPSSTATS